MNNAQQLNLYGNYRNKKFTDVWESADAFLDDYKNNGISASISDGSATTLYYLLYARYGNSTIASSDETQFKYKVFSTIFMYGPTWEKRLSMQKEIRDLTLQDIQDGSLVIFNHAYNPSSEPSTQSISELPYINDQTTNRYKKSITDVYVLLKDLLETDVTADFIGRFKNLFLKIVEPELPLWYITEKGDDNDN